MHSGKHRDPQKRIPRTDRRPLRDEGAKAPLDHALYGMVRAEALVLRALGFGKPDIVKAIERAIRHSTSVEEELLATGAIREEAYYAALARYLGLSFQDSIDPSQLVDIDGIDSQLREPRMVRISDGRAAPRVAIVPRAARAAQLLDDLKAMPTLSAGLLVTTPSAVRRAVWQVGAQRRARETTAALFEERPRFSARIVMSGTQGFVLGSITTTISCAFWIAPLATITVLHVCASLIYLCALAFRAMTLACVVRLRLAEDPLASARPLPVYTVLVALYKEAPVAAQLVRAIDRIDWPKALLDVKFVCEADDHETIAALRNLKPGLHCEIVEVPALGPRTKPKALSYALAAARGRYVAIYDAEDRPHPGQLREAHARFEQLPPEVACLQAPLVVGNADRHWLSALFALEYAGLFRGLMPVLARLKLPLPLGGTSNHFRADVLRQVGGWDPFNVTEDADLGIRLHRMGYRSEMMRRQTIEDAPHELVIWSRQRARWFKGWLQTWLVVTRDGPRAWREMGPVAYLVFHLLIGGMLVSAFIHPAMLIFFTATFIAMLDVPRPPQNLLSTVLFVVDTLNVFGAYACFLALGRLGMIAHERRMVARRWLWLPVYWLLMTAAAWRAVLDLRFAPHHWHKTPHAPMDPKDRPGKQTRRRFPKWMRR